MQQATRTESAAEQSTFLGSGPTQSRMDRILWVDVSMSSVPRA